MSKQTTKRLFARMDHGRWIVDCPNGCNTAEYAADTFVCSCCNPDVMAFAYRLREDGLYDRVPDPAVRAEARLQAAAIGQIFEVEFPEDKQEIEKILRKRPIQNMNWSPGETLEQLRKENIQHGLE